MAKCSGVSIDCGGFRSHSFDDVPLDHSIGIPTFPEPPCACPMCMLPDAFAAEVFAEEELVDEEVLCSGAPVCHAA